MSKIKKEELYVPQPPSELFAENKSSVEQVVEQSQVMFIVERIDYPEEGGIYVYFRNCLYPDKGFPYVEAAIANNIVKKITLTLLSSFAQKEILISMLWFIFLSRKRKLKIIEKILSSYFHTVDYIFISKYLKDRYYMKCAIGLRDWITNFLILIGIDKKIASGIGRIVAMIIQYDNAYRYRIQDAFSETTKERLMNNPRKELKRILQLVAERDRTFASHIDTSTSGKFMQISRIISLVLMYKPFKDAFVRSLSTIDFSLIQYDEADRYWCLCRDDYNHFGLNLYVRKGIFINMHKGIPPPNYRSQFIK